MLELDWFAIEEADDRGVTRVGVLGEGVVELWGECLRSLDIKIADGLLMFWLFPRRDDSRSGEGGGVLRWEVPSIKNYASIQSIRIPQVRNYNYS